MRRVVFDTSIWIEYFKSNPVFFTICQSYLDNASVFTLEIIFAELMQGAKGQREVGIINGYFENLHKLDYEGLVYEAGLFSQNEKLVARGIGLIDAIIIYATVINNLQLWTLDKKIGGYLDSRFIFVP
ncbi:MAG TPA: PIN domain-containing protein [Cyclobacteriaceae bacterium]|nr:PIN domain-containing protein [Cyclobacteriaceae bacterium]